MKKTFLIYLLVLTACTNISKRENDPKDIERAKKVAESFLSFVKEKNNDNALALCSVGPIDLEKEKLILHRLDSLCGNVKEYTITWAKTTVTTTNGKTEGQYNLKYKVQYENGVTEEDFTLSLIDDSVKIIGHHAIKMMDQ